MPFYKATGLSRKNAKEASPFAIGMKEMRKTIPLVSNRSPDNDNPMSHNNNARPDNSNVWPVLAGGFASARLQLPATANGIPCYPEQRIYALSF